MASEMLEQLSNSEDEDIIPERRTRADAAANPGNDYSDFLGYLLTRSVEDALISCYDKVISIVTDLKHVLETRLSPLLENDVFKSISLILDSSSYQHTSIDSLIADQDVVMQYFNDMFTTNNCNTIDWNQAFEVLHDHVTRFLPNHSPEKCWPIILKIDSDLGITNLLHLIEICLVMPLANTEAECVFLFLWQVFSKEHQSMKHETLEMLLYLHGGADFQKE